MKQRGNIIALGMGVLFIFLAGGAAFLTALLFGVSETSQVVAVGLIALATSAVGALILLIIAYAFSQKGKGK